MHIIYDDDNYISIEDQLRMTRMSLEEMLKVQDEHWEWQEEMNRTTPSDR